MTARADWLKGCGTALVTPFTAQGAVDEACMTRLIERQIAGAVPLLVPCGTTGESATLSDDEQRKVIALTVKAAKGKARVIAGAGGSATAGVIERAQAAKAAGADAVLVLAPPYNKPTQAGLKAHFTAVAQAIGDLPLVLYNVPGRTVSNIDAGTALELAREVPNIVGIKEASGNMSQIMAILKDRPAGFRVLSGDDSLTLPLMALGAEGIISVASNEAPALMQRLTEFCLTGNWGEARTLHHKLLPLMEVNFVESSPGPVKAALHLMGLLEETFRLPLVPVQEKTRDKVKAVLAELGLLKSERPRAGARAQGH
jgi:4-hydroxy-tetrahydrodipicolinate synthase